jgi:hypothetical protein
MIVVFGPVNIIGWAATSSAVLVAVASSSCVWSAAVQRRNEESLGRHPLMIEKCGQANGLDLLSVASLAGLPERSPARGGNPVKLTFPGHIQT